MVEHFDREVRQLLTANRSFLDAIVDQLTQKRFLTYMDLNTIREARQTVLTREA